jgi:hypothetical protein
VGVHITTGGSPWLPYLIGAASAVVTAIVVQLVVQFYIVPRGDTRKRREDRWERDVRELGELLTTSLADRAQEAFSAQSGFRHVLELEHAVGVDHDKVARMKDEYTAKARQATAAFNDLAHTRVPWLVDRVASVGPTSGEIVQFKIAARHHQIRAMTVDGWSEDYGPHDGTFDEAWDQEREARRALVKQVTVLLDMPHPPRVSWLGRCWQRGGVRARRAINRTTTVSRRAAEG